jgi:hypothetical protein
VAADLIVVDVEIAPFMDNRVLDEAHMARFPGGSVYSRLVEEARSRGWQVVTADRFLADRPAFGRAVTLSNELTAFLAPLRALGARPGLLWSGESPNVARRFYRSLPSDSEPFRHALLFRGSLSRLHPSVKPHPLLWPVPPQVTSSDPPWSGRRLLGAVAALKGAWRSPREIVRGLPGALRSQWEQAFQPAMRFEDLYGLRMELVRRFGPDQGFVLRGTGWERIRPGEAPWWRRPIPWANEPTPCDDKLEVLAGCRFALTLENASYPGYVTEKIFDAFRAGTVPVYMGAPDIRDFVPEDCFVDYRQFPTPEALWSHLQAMPEGRWREYREAARRFLASPRFERHQERDVARQWMEWLEDAAR